MTDRVLGILAFAAFGALIIIIAVWVIWVVDAIRRGERETKKIIREWEKIEAQVKGDVEKVQMQKTYVLQIKKGNEWVTVRTDEELEQALNDIFRVIEAAGGNLIPVIEDVRDNAETTD